MLLYFKIFVMGHNLDKQIKKAGFKVNAYKEVRTYTVGNGGIAKISNRMLLPENYKYDGNIWVEVELPLFERYFCLMRLPELQFEQLWELFINTQDKHDEIGSISQILKKYNKELLEKLTEYQKNNNVDKIKKKKFRMIWDFINTDPAKSLYTDSIQDVLQDILKKRK